ACVTQLIPAHPRQAGPVGVHRVVDHHGLVVAEVAVGQPVHQPVGQVLKLDGSAGLGDAGPAGGGAQLAVEGSGGQDGRACEGRISGVGPVHVEPEDVKLVLGSASAVVHELREVGGSA